MSYNGNVGITAGGGKRSAGLDFVRSCAILFVIAGHFFVLNTPFYDVPFEGISLFLQASVLPLFLTGVPLFLMLTGYLNANKAVCRPYYRGIWRVLLAYFLFSVLTLAFRRYYLHEQLGILQGLHKITMFSAIPYAWYIEMWIGLFLVTPFLNILYKNIPCPRHKQLLILTLFMLTAVPECLNRYGCHLVPGYWQACYPVMFYFIGSYIKEFQPTVKPVYLLGVIVACSLVTPVFNALFVHHHTIIKIAGGSYGVFGTAIAVAFFLLIYRSEVKNTAVAKVFAKVSLLALDMYLCCYIFDAIYYPWFKEHFFISQQQFGIYFFVVVPLVFLSSFVVAQMKAWLFQITRLDRL